MMHGVGKLAVLRSFAQFQNQCNEMLYIILDRLMEALFLNFFLPRSSSCCPRFLELISIVLILETLDLCLFFLNFKEAVNQR